MLKANCDIRTRAKEAGIKLWQISTAVGMHDSNFSKKMRQELSDDEKQQIFEIIEKIARQNSSEGRA